MKARGQDVGNEKIMLIVKWGMRILMFALLPLTHSLPTSIFVYFITSNTWNIFQVSFFRQNAIKKYFNIPTISKNPLNEIKKEKSQLETTLNKMFPQKKEQMQSQNLLTQKQLSNLKKNITENIK
jgi:hypothetical protein